MFDSIIVKTWGLKDKLGLIVTFLPPKVKQLNNIELPSGETMDVYFTMIVNISQPLKQAPSEEMRYWRGIDLMETDGFKKEWIRHGMTYEKFVEPNTLYNLTILLEAYDELTEKKYGDYVMYMLFR